ncbi:MAG: hypothetical protein HY815_01030, partial [Candidatus Riflebacteria bacterium]|nr:hypothetical protein [Candidatus Riflebacteria bacterium]
MSRRHRPLLISLVALWGCVAVLLFLSVRANQGRLVYALDDAYIHMSIAR